MFNKLKKKIADGVEGVSPGRTTPLSSRNHDSSRGEEQAYRRQQVSLGDDTNEADTSLNITNSSVDGNHKSSPQEVLARVHHLLEVGRAQAKNSKKLDVLPDQTTEIAEDVSSSSLLDESLHTPNNEVAVRTPLRRQRMNSTSSNVSGVGGDERSDYDTDTESRIENLSLHELRDLYKKQYRTLRKYKMKFSEVVGAFKSLQKEKEKLESALASGQDKQLRRISELKETISLEQEGKRHLEETLRLDIEEKDEMIQALQTQVQLLKTKFGVTSPMNSPDAVSAVAVVDGGASDIDNTRNIKKKPTDHLTCEEEKKKVISESMEKMSFLIAEQDALKSEIKMLQDELNKKDIEILNMHESNENMESDLRKQLMKEIKEDLLSNAVTNQEEVFRAAFAEKEAAIKETFANKVHDLQRIMEEKEHQRDLMVASKDEELMNAKEKLNKLQEEIDEWKEKEGKFKEKMAAFHQEKQDLLQKIDLCGNDLEAEKAKIPQLKEKNENQIAALQAEHSEQIAKIKRVSQTKVYDIQEQLRKKNQELNESTKKIDTLIETRVKEAQQNMQSEHAKASRKLEVKVSDMKKVIKELRLKLDHQENEYQKLEKNFQDSQAELEQLQKEHSDSINRIHEENLTKSNNLDQEKSVLMQEFENNVIAKENEIKIMKQELETLQCKISELNSKIEETEKTKANCEQVLCEKDKEIEDLVHTLQEKEREIQRQIFCMKENTVSQLELTTSYEKQVEVLKNEIAAKEFSFKDEIDDLRNRLSDVQQNKEKLEREYENEKFKYNDLLSEKTTEDERSNEKLNALKAKSLHQEELNEQMQELLTELKQEEKILREELDSLKTQFETVQNESSSLTNDLEKKVKEINLLKTELDDTKTLLSQQKLDEGQVILIKDQELSTLKTKLKQAIEDCEQLKQEKTELIKTHAETLENVESSHKKNIDDLKKNFENELHSKDVQVTEKINELLQEKNASESDYLLQLENSYKQSYNDLKVEGEKKLDECEELYKQKISSVNNEHEIQLQTIQTSLQEKESEIGKLTDQMDKNKFDYENMKRNFENEIIQLTSQSEKSDNACKQLMSELTEKEKLLTHALENNKHLVEKIELQKNKEGLITSDVKNILLKIISSLKGRIMEREVSFIEYLTTIKSEVKKLLKMLNENDSVNENDNAKFCKLCANNCKEQIQCMFTENQARNNFIEKFLSNLEKQFSSPDDIRFDEMDFEPGDSAQIIEDRNTRIEELLIEKCDLEQMLVDCKQTYEDRLNKLLNEIESKSSNHMDTINNLKSEHKSEMEKIEAERREETEKHVKDIEESSKGKLMEMKKKAENTINKLKKHLNEKVSGYEEKISTYEKNIADLKNELSELSHSYEESEKQNKNYSEQLLILEEKNQELQAFSSELTSQQKHLSAQNEEQRKIYKENEDKRKSLIDELFVKHQNEIQSLKDEENIKKSLLEKQLQESITEKELAVKSLNEKLEEEEKSKELLQTNFEQELQKVNTEKASLEIDLKKEIEEITIEKQLLEEKLKQELNEAILLKGNCEESLKRELEEHISAKDLSEKTLKTELNTLKEQLRLKSEKLADLEKKMEYMTVEKMDALKSLQQELKEEHDAITSKIHKDAEEKFRNEEKKLIAKVDERDFEYNSKIKQLMKEFQAQLGAKDREIQQAVQEAIEDSQKEERRIICEYDEQIMEMRHELHLREQDMLELRTSTESEIETLRIEKENIEQESEEKLSLLEQDYNKRLSDLVKRHEEEMLNLTNSKSLSSEDAAKLEEKYQAELASQEKKYKSQLKRTKNELRKLLLEKGAFIPNGDDTADGRNSSSEDQEDIDRNEVFKLKEKVASMAKELQSLREREKYLAVQVENSSVQSPNKNRPATLVLDENPMDSTSSSPKSPQPMEFEYLRNILFQYMVGNQRKQMAKVLTAIVHFSPSQVKQILAKVDEQEAQLSEKKSSSWL